MDQTTSPKSSVPPSTSISNATVSTTTSPTPLIALKAFKYPEIYTSPTDSIMSPVSKGILLARTKSKKTSFHVTNFSTSQEQSKIRDTKFGDTGALET
uniref:uncharacterized protein LOC122590021 n=1 Tax=Erigeron canadensis TaxID=72917 RepID=UPI001CB935C7|nr:uncharacterized protein LOC122590021 [Erigeron canadensis]